MPLPTIQWEKNLVKIIDQTELPIKKTFIKITSASEMWNAIKQLKIRGAPAIGIAAAFGIYLGVRGFHSKDKKSSLENSMKCVLILEALVRLQ